MLDYQPSAQQAAIRSVQGINKQFQFRLLVDTPIEFVDSVAQFPLLAIHNLKSVFDVTNLLLRKSPSLQAFAVDAAGRWRLPRPLEPQRSPW